MDEWVSRANFCAYYGGFCPSVPEYAVLWEGSCPSVPEYAVLWEGSCPSVPEYVALSEGNWDSVPEHAATFEGDWYSVPEPAALCEGHWNSGLEYDALREGYLDSAPNYLDRGRDYLENKENYFNAMRDYFLASKRDESTPEFFTHDVFLSFRGKDVRKTVVDRLYKDLSKAGLRVFLDSENLKKGEIIWPSLERAMEKSAICIPIFSQGYADSTWCLKEAAAMLKSPHLIIPLFYGVDPTHVRYPLNKKSPYKKSFEKHYGRLDRHLKEEIDGWKLGLEDICSRLGWTMDITDDFNVGVERIVKDVIGILHS